MDDSIDSSPEQQGYQTESFVVTRWTELPDTVSSVLHFQLLVESSGFSMETLGIIKAADHLKGLIWCFDHILYVKSIFFTKSHKHCKSMTILIKSFGTKSSNEHFFL